MEKSQLRISERKLKEGNRRIQKQSNHQKPSSNSSPRSSTCTTVDEDLLRYHSGGQSTNRVLGTPIKKLLAEEMSKETVSRKRSPGLIARLMGLDGLPPQQSSHTQQKRSSENRVRSTEKAQRNGSFSSSQFSRKSTKDEQEFKDVFEVVDMRKLGSRIYSPGSANSELSESEMEFIQRKFMDAKRLSADGKLHGSKEFDEVIQDLDFNKELLLKYLDRPDTLFAKHLHDLQGGQLYSPLGYHSARKSSCFTERRTPPKNRRKTNDASFNSTSANHAGQSHLNCSKIHLEGKEGSTVVPTRIVILKPNLGRLRNASRNDLSPRSSCDFLSDCEKHAELLGIKKKAVEISALERSCVNEGSSRYKSKESREVAKQISRQKRSGFPDGSIYFFDSKSKGYVGDESSTDCSENESAFEADVKPLTSRNLMEWSNRYRSSSFRSTESSVSKEAKRRLSERWKMTHNSIDMGVISRGSTLGDILAINDKEVTQENAAAFLGVTRNGPNLDAISGPAVWVEPLGISSLDGWKGEYLRDLPTSRSLPSSSVPFSSPRRGIHYQALYNDKYLIPSEVIQQDRNKLVKANISQKNGPSFRNCRSHCRKSHVHQAACSELTNTPPENFLPLNLVQRDITEDGPVKQYPVASGTSAGITMDDILAADSVTDVIENAVLPSQLPSSSCTSSQGYSFSIDLGTTQKTIDGLPGESSFVVQKPSDQQKLSMSSKEADQPSPVSVLEAPFPDGMSSGSDCFGSVSADLHGLRMQLQLLKLESQAYAEESTIVSSDEEVDHVSNEISDEGGLAEESEEFSYICDLLINSGIDDANLHSYVASCHSLEYPVSTGVFEELEKKYSGHDASWPRSERKLLFDLMNLALCMIYHKSANPLPWVRTTSKISGRWMRNGLMDGLRKLLFSQNVDTLDKMLLGDLEWVDNGEDIDAIGREIERLLTEELIAELVL